jgi:gas vesicle protein
MQKPDSRPLRRIGAVSFFRETTVVYWTRARYPPKNNAMDRETQEFIEKQFEDLKKFISETLEDFEEKIKDGAEDFEERLDEKFEKLQEELEQE